MDDKHESTNAFTFMRSYYDQIEEVKAISAETALEYFEAICRYALDNERYDGDNLTIKALMHGVYPVIDRSHIKRKANQRNGRKGGRPKESTSSFSSDDETSDTEEESHPERTADFLRTLSNELNLNATEQQVQNFIGHHASINWTRARTPAQVKEKFRRWIEEDRMKRQTTSQSRKPYIPEGRPENEMRAQIYDIEMMANSSIARNIR